MLKMLGIIGETALKYIIEAILAAVIAAIGIAFKRYKKLSDQDRKKGQEEYYAKLQNDIIESNKQLISEVLQNSKDGDLILQKQIDGLHGEVDVLKAGVLSIQGRSFKNECRSLLKPEVKISVEELEEVTADYEAYHALGGNGKGKQLYDLVVEKAKQDITK